MQCEQAETCLAQLAAGDSVDGDTTLIEAAAHVETCETCREKLADYRLALKLLADGFAKEAEQSGPIPTLSADRRAKLEARFNAPPELVATAPAVEQPNRFNIRNYLRPLGVAASFGLVALGAWGLMNTIQGQPAFSTVATVWDDELPELEVPEANSALIESTGDLTTPADYDRPGDSDKWLAGKAGVRSDSGADIRLYADRIENLENENAQLQSEVVERRTKQLDAEKRLVETNDALRTRTTEVEALVSQTRLFKEQVEDLALENGEGLASAQEHWSFKGNKDLGGNAVDNFALDGSKRRSLGYITDGKDASVTHANDDRDGDGITDEFATRRNKLKFSGHIAEVEDTSALSALDRLERTVEDDKSGEFGGGQGLAQGQGRSTGGSFGWTGKKADAERGREYWSDGDEAQDLAGGGGAGGKLVVGGEAASEGRADDSKPASESATRNGRPVVAIRGGHSGSVSPPAPIAPTTPAPPAPKAAPPVVNQPRDAAPDASRGPEDFAVPGQSRPGGDWKSSVAETPDAPDLPAEPQPESAPARGNRASESKSEFLAEKVTGSRYDGGVQTDPAEAPTPANTTKELADRRAPSAKPAAPAKPAPDRISGIATGVTFSQESDPVAPVDPAKTRFAEPRGLADVEGRDNDTRWDRGRPASGESAQASNRGKYEYANGGLDLVDEQLKQVAEKSEELQKREGGLSLYEKDLEKSRDNGRQLEKKQQEIARKTAELNERLDEREAKGKSGTVVDNYANVVSLREAQVNAQYGKAMQAAREAEAAGNHAKAIDARTYAKAVIDQNRQYLTESEYRQKRSEVTDEIARAHTAHDKSRVREITDARQEAITERSSQRKMAAQERERKVGELLKRASDNRKELDYEKAHETLDQLLFLDPNNIAANAMKDMIDDAIIYRNFREVDKVRSQKLAQNSIENHAAAIRHTELLTNPADWPQLSAIRLGQLQKTDPTKAAQMIRDFERLDREAADRATRLSELQADLPLLSKGSRAWDETRKKLEEEAFDLRRWQRERVREVVEKYTDAPQLSAIRLQALQSSGGETEVDERVAEKLTQRIPVNFDGNRLENVVEYLRNVTGANIVVNWRQLEAAGIKPSDTVTLQLASVPAKDALRLALERVAGDAADTSYSIDAGVVTVTASPRADAETDNLPAASNFKSLPVNPFVMTERDRFSTFGIDTDSASYALARKYVRAGFRPPAGAIRMEEFVNAFDYNYANQSGRVFTVHAEAGDAPYGENLTLVKVGVKAKTIGRENRKPAHLVFVIDASGSMDRPDRLPLVKHSLGLLVSQLGPTDRVTIVAYGTKPIAVVEAAPASHKDKLRNAINSVQAGGSTNMIDALGMGYDFARNHFKPGEINRVIVCSDGVANVGATEAQRMLDKVAANRTQGITLTNIGFGIGGYNDALMTDLAKKGDGNYVFVDTTAEAKRLFVDQLASTLQTVAKDAKIQVEFDPARVRRYRLIGYEARDIADKDFRNDTVDAGEVGSGQSATALYEVELLPAANNDNAVELADLGTVFVRYKNVDTGEVEEISSRLRTDLIRKRTTSDDPRFYLAACAAEYAEVLRGSVHARGASIEAIERKLIPIVQQLPLDRQAAELLDLVRRTKGLPAAP